MAEWNSKVMAYRYEDENNGRSQVIIIVEGKT